MSSDSDDELPRSRDLRDLAPYMQALGWASFAGLFFGAMVGGNFLPHGLGAFRVIIGAAGGMLVMSTAAIVLVKYILHPVAAGVGHMVLSGDRGGTGVGYSHIEAMEARGNIDGALSAWEDVIAAAPDAIAARVNAADLYARKTANHVRAMQIFREVQRHAHAPAETKRYVTQRMIDLYLGPLGEPGRALVELRRVAETWPGTPEAAGAVIAIANLKRQGIPSHPAEE